MKKSKTNEEIAEEVSMWLIRQKGVVRYVKEGFGREDIIKAVLRALKIREVN